MEKNTAPDFAAAIPVAGINAEYDYLAAQRCPACGGPYQFEQQALVQHAGQPYDLMTVCCRHCKATRAYVFDISSFFGKGC